MKVSVKDFTIQMEVKTNGMEFEVRDPDGTFRGDFFITKTGLVWCEGRTDRDNGVKVSWKTFMDWASLGAQLTAEQKKSLKEKG